VDWIENSELRDDLSSDEPSRVERGLRLVGSDISHDQLEADDGALAEWFLGASLEGVSADVLEHYLRFLAADERTAYYMCDPLRQLARSAAERFADIAASLADIVGGETLCRELEKAIDEDWRSDCYRARGDAVCRQRLRSLARQHDGRNNDEALLAELSRALYTGLTGTFGFRSAWSLNLVEQAPGKVNLLEPKFRDQESATRVLARQLPDLPDEEIIRWVKVFPKLVANPEYRVELVEAARAAVERQGDDEALQILNAF
jgi:hypothetical protein